MAHEEVRDSRVPVLLISGWLGSGKTTMVEHLLKSASDLRLGVLVNDMAAVNVDAAILSRVVHRKEDMVEFSNGCICCTLRPDFVAQLADLAASEPKFDAIIVESTGISEPQQVAEAFDLPTEDGDSDNDEENHEESSEIDETLKSKEVELMVASSKLRANARLDCTLSVVDALNFPRDIPGGETLQDRSLALGPEDDRAVSELLVQQVEFADVLVINKIDLFNEPIEKESLIGILRSLNPRAKIITTSRSQVSAKELINCRAFNLSEARKTTDWLQSLVNSTPESEEYGISNFVFNSRRPFHPARLHKLLFGPGGSSIRQGETITMESPFSPDHPFAGVVRSKGQAWFASPWGIMQKVLWAQAGRAWQFGAGEYWTSGKAAVLRGGPVLSKKITSKVESSIAAPNWIPDKAVGDRETKIVIIGVRMKAEVVQQALEESVLTDDEWAIYLRASDFVEDDARTQAKMIAESGSETGGNESGDDSDEAEEKETKANTIHPDLDPIMDSAWAGAWDFDSEDEDTDDDSNEDDENEAVHEAEEGTEKKYTLKKKMEEPSNSASAKKAKSNNE